LLRYTRPMFAEYLKKHAGSAWLHRLAMKGLALMEQMDPPQ
jgi:hypothetical protein